MSLGLWARLPFQGASQGWRSSHHPSCCLGPGHSEGQTKQAARFAQKSKGHNDAPYRPINIMTVISSSFGCICATERNCSHSSFITSKHLRLVRSHWQRNPDTDRTKEGLALHIITRSLWLLDGKIAHQGTQYQDCQEHVQTTQRCPLGKNRGVGLVPFTSIYLLVVHLGISSLLINQ